MSVNSESSDGSNKPSLQSPVEPSGDTSLVGKSFIQFVDTIRKLRSPGGCPWDLAQTHQSLVSFAIEETYELVEAIQSSQDSSLKEELGDVLLQVVLHGIIAEQRGAFSIAEIVDGINEKMIFRHPHVFRSGEAEHSSITDPDSAINHFLDQKEKAKRAAAERGVAAERGGAATERGGGGANDARGVGGVGSATAAHGIGSVGAAAAARGVDGVIAATDARDVDGIRNIGGDANNARAVDRATIIGGAKNARGVDEFSHTNDLRGVSDGSATSAVSSQSADSVVGEEIGVGVTRGRVGEDVGSFEKIDFGIPLALPALQKSQKIGEKTKRAKFDWSSAEQVLAKVQEELAELQVEVRSKKNAEYIEEELGDVLFTLAQLGRHLQIDTEQCLQKANKKFESRFFKMLELGKISIDDFKTLSSQQKEDLWEKSKAALRK